MLSQKGPNHNLIFLLWQWLIFFLVREGVAEFPPPPIYATSYITIARRLQQIQYPSCITFLSIMLYNLFKHHRPHRYFYF